MIKNTKNKPDYHHVSCRSIFDLTRIDFWVPCARMPVNQSPSWSHFRLDVPCFSLYYVCIITVYLSIDWCLEFVTSESLRRESTCEVFVRVLNWLLGQYLHPSLLHSNHFCHGYWNFNHTNKHTQRNCQPLSIQYIAFFNHYPHSRQVYHWHCHSFKGVTYSLKTNVYT